MRAGFLLLLWLCACSIATNFDDPNEPRYGENYSNAAPGAQPSIKVVTYNLQFGEHVDRAIAVLASPPFDDADVILMQEMDGVGSDQLAAALDLNYVYYPGSLHGKTGRDFGVGIFSRWPLRDDHKLLLPHLDPFNGRRRIAVRAQVDCCDEPVTVYSTHMSVPTLGLGARLDQVQFMLDDPRPTNMRTVIGGDFNTADPGSVGQTVDRATAAGFVRASAAVGDTVRRFGFGYELDHIFVHGLTMVAAGRFDEDAGSDHAPIWVTVE